MTIQLSRATVSSLPAGFEAPRYDLTGVAPGIVHIGLGGFHRAHMARYNHDLFGEDGSALGWAIVGAGLRTADVPLLEVLAAQEGLYSLIERDAGGETRALIGSIVGVIDASQGSAALLAAIDDPRIRIVSTTVTEHGYHLDRATKTLNVDDPAIAADLADPAAPRTTPAILVEAYRRRRDTGRPPFTTLCCDNIQHNGNVLRAAVIAFAERRDPGLAAWIATEAAFPNSMVDRITPVPTAAEIAAFAAETGLDDQASLRAERFRQWVIEDRFVGGRPAWEKVGAYFVEDVTAYEYMKLRLLNASHLAIAGLGQLLGLATIGESIAHPLVRRVMIALMDRETGPTLQPVPGVDLADYKRTLVERFANPAIEDTNQRVNSDAPINLLLDPIRDRLAGDAPIPLLALALAAWCRRVGGIGEDGKPLHVVHPLAALLAERAREGGGDPTPLLAIDEVFGPLGRDPRLIEAVRAWLEPLYARGVAAVLADGAADGFY